MDVKFVRSLIELQLFIAVQQRDGLHMFGDRINKPPNLALIPTMAGARMRRVGRGRCWIFQGGI